MSTKTLLLTGSGGFIGNNLKEYLKKNYKLLCPRSFELNLCDTKAVREYFINNEIDLIVHCATVGGARGVQDRPSTLEDNLSMVDNLLDFKEKGAKVILFSSGAMYDKSRNLHKVCETEIGECVPVDLYGKSKMMIAKKAENREDVVCLNVFACYGRGEKSSRFPTYAINQNIRHEAIEINQNVVFDYLYIKDLLKIVDFMLENKPKYNILNATPDISITLKEIAETVNEISGFKSPIIIKKAGMNFEYTGDNSRLKEVMPGFEFTDYETGLRELYGQIKAAFQR